MRVSAGRRAWRGFLMLLALTAGPVTGRAQAAGSDWEDAERDPAEVDVQLLGQAPGLVYDVYPAQAEPGRDQSLETCRGSCSLRLRPGKYRLVLHDTKKVSGGQRVFEIEEASQVLVGPREPGAAYLGLSFGIAGSVAAFAGAVLVTPSVLSANCHNGDRCEDHTTTGAIGLALLVGGAVATPIGWSAFARNLRPRAEVRATSGYESRGPSVELHGCGLSAKMSF